MKKMTLGVSSSISIYKACEILRGFQKNGVDVQVIMTKNATHLVSPLLFSALSGHRVMVDPFEEEPSRRIAHIDLAKEISLFLVAPATANIIGKFATGIADDFLSTFFMAVRCPVLLAPAMNEAMYIHGQTQMNIQRLRSTGVEFVEPEQGYLACEEEGWGRLASPERIIQEGLRLMGRKESLRTKKILITAGPTQEFLDPVRFLSNRSSGKMGYALAEEAVARGAEVVLVSGPAQIPAPQNCALVKVQTAHEMAEEVERHFRDADIIVMAAAVSDFSFPVTAPQKIKKTQLRDKLRLIPTEDILQKLAGKRGKGRKILVGFAAETEAVVDNAIMKMREKKLDLIVANDVSQEGIGFDSDFNQVFLIDAKGTITRTERMSKREVSRVILDSIEGLLEKKNG